MDHTPHVAKHGVVLVRDLGEAGDQLRHAVLEPHLDAEVDL
jgi:hypothetical protein